MTPEERKALEEQGKQAIAAKHWEEAIAVYSQLWALPERTADYGWRLAQAHYKLNRLDEALVLCREVFHLDSAHNPNRNLYAWTIFKGQFLAKPPKPLHVLRKATEGILQLAEIEDAYSPARAAILKLVDELEESNLADPNERIDWLEKLNPSTLSTQCDSFEAKGRRVELASPLESYYAHLTKALFDAERYEECIEACETALKRIREPHYNNGIWWRRRIVMSRVKQGDADTALAEMRRIALEKGDWFLWDELGDLLLELGKEDEAIKAYYRALPGWNEMKVGFWQQLGTLLAQKGDLESAKALANAAFAVRQASGWKIPLVLKDLLAQCGLDPESPAPTVKDARKELEKTIDRLTTSMKEWHEGTVINVLPNLKAAFIKGSHGADNAFAPSRVFPGKLSAELRGKKVRYLVEEGFDKAKNRKSMVVNRLDIIP